MSTRSVSARATFCSVFPAVTELLEFVQTLPGDTEKTGALLEVRALQAVTTLGYVQRWR